LLNIFASLGERESKYIEQQQQQQQQQQSTLQHCAASVAVSCACAGFSIACQFAVAVVVVVVGDAHAARKTRFPLFNTAAGSGGYSLFCCKFIEENLKENPRK